MYGKSLVKSHCQELVPELVDVVPGQFWMGCGSGRADEAPVHRVSVSAFSMGKTTVTNYQYRLFLQETGVEVPALLDQPEFNHPCQPVVSISWIFAMKYCEWLSESTGGKFRLPTEAEWEWAIRGGRESALYSWGDEPPETIELYRTGWTEQRPHIVGLYPPNSFGLYDLGDNVHEWCLDWYDPEFYSRSGFCDPVNSRPSERRSSRGGAWRHRIKVSRCAARSSLAPHLAYADYGFRVVKEPMNTIPRTDL